MNVWAQIDLMERRFNADLERTNVEAKKLRGSGVRVHPVSGVWRVRFRPYGAEVAEVLRGRTSEELLSALAVASKKSEAAREAAKAARAEARRLLREKVKRTRAALRELAGVRRRVRRVRVRRKAASADRWSCEFRSATGAWQEVDDEYSPEGLIDTIRSLLSAEGVSHA